MQSTKRQNSHDQLCRLSAFDVASGYTALPKTITKDTVFGDAFRIDCEQDCYFQCSNAELKRFVKDRDIDVLEGRFRRSTDLPPELGNVPGGASQSGTAAFD
ncbi:hypothetical protein LTR81_026829 [Elasticomyces elasticus]